MEPGGGGLGLGGLSKWFLLLLANEKTLQFNNSNLVRFIPGYFQPLQGK